MTKSQLEAAARKLCELRNQNPDEIINYTSTHSDANCIGSRWMVVQDEIEAHVNIANAIAFGHSNIPMNLSDDRMMQDFGRVRRPAPATGRIDTGSFGNDQWRDAVLDQCAIACLDGDFTDPRATLGRLITWHVQMALDPRISEAAAGLVLAAKVEALEWAATICKDEADSAGDQARNGGTAFDDGRELAARTCGDEIRAGKGYTS